MLQYNYLPHTADVKFEAFGISLRDCFRNAGLAMCNAMYETKKVSQKKSVKIELQADSLDQLLHRFLEEILYRIDTEQMLFSEFKISIIEKDNSLSGELLGEPIDAAKHTIKAMVKAVTWHEFFLKKEKTQWKCIAIVDV